MDASDREKIGTRIACIVMALVIAVGFIGVKGFKNKGEKIDINDTSVMCKKLTEYTRKVYAPKSMDEFNEAKKEAIESGVMTDSVASQFFRAYSDKLTEADLGRTCLARTAYSGKEMGTTNVDQYMVSAYLYNTPTASPIKITVLFRASDGGTIDNYDIVVGI